MASLLNICVAVSMFVAMIQAAQMLAIAPVTALARWDGFGRRELFGDCPAATQTLCPDHLGCCPNGAACTFSRDIPVCDESCNGGPSCPRGGCCQVGYVCGTNNNYCTPAATTHPKYAVETPVTTTASADIVTSVGSPVEHSPVSTPAGTAVESATEIATIASTTTTASKTAARELANETASMQSTDSSIIKANTPIRASSPHHAAGAIATAITATAHDGSKFVGPASGSQTKVAGPSAQATSSGATLVFVSGPNGLLVGLILGWLVSYCFLIQ